MVDPVTLWIFCWAAAWFLIGAAREGGHAVAGETRLVREQIRRSVTDKRTEIRERIDRAGRSSPAADPLWGVWAARAAGRGVRNWWRGRNGPAAIGGKPRGPLRRIGRAMWEGGKASAAQTWRQHKVKRSMPRQRPPRQQRPPRRPGRAPRPAPAPPAPGPWAWTLAPDAPAASGTGSPGDGTAARVPALDAPAPQASLAAAPPAAPQPEPVPVHATGRAPAQPLPTGGQLVAGQLTPRTGGITPAIPPGAAGLGEARTHGMWLQSAHEFAAWLDAQGRLLAGILDNLHAVDGARDQVTGTIDYAQATREFITKLRAGIAKVDPPEQRIMAAIPGGDPANINAMTYYTEAVQ